MRALSPLPQRHPRFGWASFGDVLKLLDARDFHIDYQSCRHAALLRTCPMPTLRATTRALTSLLLWQKLPDHPGQDTHGERRHRGRFRRPSATPPLKPGVKPGTACTYMYGFKKSRPTYNSFYGSVGPRKMHIIGVWRGAENLRSFVSLLDFCVTVESRMCYKK